MIRGVLIWVAVVTATMLDLLALSPPEPEGGTWCPLTCLADCDGFDQGPAFVAEREPSRGVLKIDDIAIEGSAASERELRRAIKRQSAAVGWCFERTQPKGVANPSTYTVNFLVNPDGSAPTAYGIGGPVATCVAENMFGMTLPPQPQTLVVHLSLSVHEAP